MSDLARELRRIIDLEGVCAAAADRIDALEAEVERLTKKAEERERVWAEHVARREAVMDDDKRATVRWAERKVERLRALVPTDEENAEVRRLKEWYLTHRAALAGER